MTSRGYAHPVRRVITGPIGLGIAFAIAHAWLAWLLWNHPAQPFADVIVVYRDWIVAGVYGDIWPGLTGDFVYPPLALVPIALAAVGGLDGYGWTWLAIVVILDATAVAVLITRGWRGVLASWWWLAFLVLAGPVALGRLEAIVTPVAIIGVAFIATRPSVASALLAIGAWIKIWPAAILGAMLVALKDRVRILIAALLVSAAVLGYGLIAGLLLGGDPAHLLSFLGGHSGRGVQVESLLAAPWLIQAALGSTEAAVSWNAALNTVEVIGPGAELAAAASTPLMVLGVLAIAGLGVVAMRRGAPSADVLVTLGVGLTAVLVVTNKVGSPQFATWLAAPVVLAILSRRGIVPATAALIIAGITQVVYPWGYGAVLEAALPAVIVLELRNLVWIALLAWAIAELADAIRALRRTAQSAVEDGD